MDRIYVSSWIKRHWIDLVLFCVCVAMVSAMIVEGPQKPSTAPSRQQFMAIHEESADGSSMVTTRALPAVGDPSPPMPIWTVDVDLGDPVPSLTMPIMADGGTLRTDCECHCEAGAVPTWTVVAGCAAVAYMALALLVIAVLLVRLHSKP